MSSFLKSIWDVVGSEVSGLLGTDEDEQNRQEKVTNILIDQPYEFGKKIGLFQDKIEAPPVINNFDPNASTTENFKTSLMDMSANAGQDSEVFRKNIPSSLFEIGEFGIDLAMNPIKYGKEAINLTSGLATMPFDNIGNANNEAMAQSVIDNTIEFFGTEGAVRKAALENPADVLFIMMGGASGIRRLQAMKPETKERMMSVIQRVGATPVGLSMKDVSNTNLSKVDGNTDLVNDGRQLAPIDEAGFYSKATQTVLDSMPKDLPKEQLRGWFEKRGVSQTELGDLGILNMIDNMGQGDKVTKEGLLEHIADQDLTFKTKVLGAGNVDSSIDVSENEMNRLSDEQNFEIPDASAQFSNRYEAINMDNYSGLSNWNDVFDSMDEPDNWLEIEGSGWRLSPDSEDRAYEFGKDIFNDEIGSYTVSAPSADGNIRGTMGGDRNLYPFNNEPYIKRQEGETYEEGFNSSYRDFMDASNLQFTVYMNKINPELYPETKSMKLKSLYMQLNKRKRMETLNYGDAELRQQLLDGTTPQEPTLEKIALLEADIMDDVRTGNVEWDMKMLEEAGKVENIYDMEGINRLKYDMEDALNMMGRDLYLNDPEFEFDIPVAGEQYRAYGNEGMGYVVETPDEGFDHNYSMFDDIYDLPALENAIREHAIERGYVDEYYDDEMDINYGDTQWGQFTLNRQHTDAPQENYKENIIQINPDKEQLRGAYQYENTVHYRGVQGMFAHIRSSDRREFGSDTNDVKFIEELQSDFQQTRRQLGATKAETDQLKYLNRMESSATGEMESVWSNLIKGLGDSPEERLLPSYATSFDGELLWKGLTKTKEQKAIYKDAMLAQTNAYQLANFQSTSGDVKKNAIEQVKKWNETWDDNEKNPDSPNWQGLNYDEYEELGQYLSEHGNALRTTSSELDNHSHTTRTPIQGDKWYTTALNHEIMKAVEDGKSTLAWANSDQILDQWNPTRQTNYKKKIKNKENYVNTYDKKITNAAKKMAKKYGGEFEVIKIDLGNGKFSENFSIRITPLMIENLKKEFPANNKSGFGRPTHGKLQQIPTGLLKTDITEQQGLIA